MYTRLKIAPFHSKRTQIRDVNGSQKKKVGLRVEMVAMVGNDRACDHERMMFLAHGVFRHDLLAELLKNVAKALREETLLQISLQQLLNKSTHPFEKFQRNLIFPAQMVTEFFKRLS